MASQESVANANGATLLYQGIRLWFSACGTGFYATTEVHGKENVPLEGPTIICFNHGNGLADPLLLIRKTPRMVRFCAKNTLWSVPVMKYFIRNSGAVPVYRAVEHGDSAKDLNTQVFAKVIEALREGACLGFAPEGVSRFLPYIEQPLKTGMARIAIEAVQQSLAAGDPAFSVALVPVGLTYTHREKFRSDVCMRYLPPLRVDAALLDRYRNATGALDNYEAARAITEDLSRAMESITFNAPTWDAMRLAMTAARLHQPTGTQLTLSQYTSLVRGWADVLSLGLEGRLQGTSKYTEGTSAERPLPPSQAASPDAMRRARGLRADLSAYQNLLDANGIKCDRVRRAAHGLGLPRYMAATGLVQRALSALVLLLIALPGVMMLAPVLWYVKRRERALLAKGRRWNDSVAEMKMMVCGMVGMGVAVSCLVASILCFSYKPAALILYLATVM